MAPLSYIFSTLTIFCLLIFTACSTKQTFSKPVYIQIKSPLICVSDAGFLDISAQKKELTLLVAGNSAFKLSLNNLACLNGTCTTRSRLLEEFGLGVLPDDTLDKILESKPLSVNQDGCVIKVNNKNFKQQCDTKELKFDYLVEDGSLSFNDRLNKIVIKINTI